jgi:hypothetical protein
MLRRGVFCLRRTVQLLLRREDRRKRRRPVYNKQFTNHQDDGGKGYRQHYVYQVPVAVHCASGRYVRSILAEQNLIRRIQFGAVDLKGRHHHQFDGIK